MDLTQWQQHLSQVGLPSSVCAQTAIVPLVNLAVPPAADFLGGAVAIPGWGSVPPQLTKKISGFGVRGHATKVMALGASGGWLLPFPSPEAWASYEFPVVGKMLHRPGGYPVDSLPKEDAALYGLLANNNKSE